MRPKDTWRLQDSNAVNESFWEADGVEIGAQFSTCSGSGDFSRILRKCRIRQKCSEFAYASIYLNLDALSVPEALAYSIRILEAPGVFLARRRHRCWRRLALKS